MNQNVPDSSSGIDQHPDRHTPQMNQQDAMSLTTDIGDEWLHHAFRKWMPPTQPSAATMMTLERHPITFNDNVVSCSQPTDNDHLNAMEHADWKRSTCLRNSSPAYNGLQQSSDVATVSTKMCDELSAICRTFVSNGGEWYSDDVYHRAADVSASKYSSIGCSEDGFDISAAVQVAQVAQQEQTDRERWQNIVLRGRKEQNAQHHIDSASRSRIDDSNASSTADGTDRLLGTSGNLGDQCHIVRQDGQTIVPCYSEEYYDVADDVDKINETYLNADGGHVAEDELVESSTSSQLMLRRQLTEPVIGARCYGMSSAQQVVVIGKQLASPHLTQMHGSHRSVLSIPDITKRREADESDVATVTSTDQVMPKSASYTELTVLQQSNGEDVVSPDRLSSMPLKCRFKNNAKECQQNGRQYV